MAQDQPNPSGPDLAQGVPATDLPDGGKLVGRVGDEDVLLVRRGADIFAIGAHCTHYDGPLADGLVVDETVRCPWHHACFDLRTGEALACAGAEPGRVLGGRAARAARSSCAGSASSRKPRRGRPVASAPDKIVIVGGGAAGFAAAEMLRRRDYQGSIVMLSADDALPCRPAEPVQGLPRRQRAGGLGAAAVAGFLRGAEHRRAPSAASAVGIDVGARQVAARAAAASVSYDRLLLATGAEPVRLSTSGRRSAARAHAAFARRLPRDHRRGKNGPPRGRHRRELHRARSGGVLARPRDRGSRGRARETAAWSECSVPTWATSCVRCTRSTESCSTSRTPQARSTANACTLKSGETLDADLVVVGVGVRPRLELAEKAGLALDRGVVVDEYLETSVPGIFAAGDIARWPDPHTGEKIRVEHWVVAERQGQTAALNMLGRARRIRRRCRSSGASTTTFRSTTSATPNDGTRSPSTATSRPRTACCASSTTAACWRSPRSSATRRASRRTSPWSVRRWPTDRRASRPARARCGRRAACPRSRSGYGSLRSRHRAASPPAAC